MPDSIASDLEKIQNMNDSERLSLINLRLAEQEELFKDIETKLKGYKILSTLQYPKVEFWTRNVITISRPQGISGLYKFIIYLFFNNRKYDLILVSGGEKTDLTYLGIAGLLNITKTPHIVVDAHWQKSKGIVHFIKRILLILGCRVTLQFQPHSEEEIGLYNRNFSIPIKKLKTIPWSTSLIGYNFIPKKGDYIQTGGASFRDYKTFLTGIRELKFPVEIGLPKDYSLPYKDIIKDMPNVLIHHSLTNNEYYQKMANCKFFALPIEPDLERCTGDQTILNAMYFGKIVIATDSIGPRLYIKHGINGFLVPESDSTAWGETIKYIYNMNDAEYSKISAQAEYTAKVVYNERMRLYKILQTVVDELHDQNYQK